MISATIKFLFFDDMSLKKRKEFILLLKRQQEIFEISKKIKSEIKKIVVIL